MEPLINAYLQHRQREIKGHIPVIYNESFKLENILHY